VKPAAETTEDAAEFAVGTCGKTDRQTGPGPAPFAETPGRGGPIMRSITFAGLPSAEKTSTAIKGVPSGERYGTKTIALYYQTPHALK
jgi:hypothetical protein